MIYCNIQYNEILLRYCREVKGPGKTGFKGPVNCCTVDMRSRDRKGLITFRVKDQHKVEEVWRCTVNRQLTNMVDLKCMNNGDWRFYERIPQTKQL